MLTFDWLVAAFALVLAAAALLKARRVSRRLERLTESYWELRYELGQLRARVTRLDPEAAASPAPDAPRQPNPTAFVPLSSLKR